MKHTRRRVPKQNRLLLPKFCIEITINPNNDTTKYA